VGVKLGHKVRVFDVGVLRKVIGLSGKKWQATGEHCAVRMRLVGHVARVRHERCLQIFDGET
jgi:hypothetical protein